jgi:hypothetical protein
MSTTPHPIKVTTTANTDPNRFRGNEIIEICAKTGKVTAVVAAMTVFCKKKKVAQR